MLMNKNSGGFDFCLYAFCDNDLHFSFCNRFLLFRESTAEFDCVV
jgi:hypothetical protein